MRESLIYWRDVPPDVDLGSFEYIANHWDGKIIVVSFNDYPIERKLCDYHVVEIENVELIIVASLEKPNEYLKNLIDNNKDAIHVFSGMRGAKRYFLDYYNQMNKNPKIVVIAERPFLFGTKIEIELKKAIFNVMYSFLNIKFHKAIKCFLPLGEIGVKTYEGYGWNKEIFFPYMYNPKLPVIHNAKISNRKTKFLYVGRFDDNSKGVDILMDAIDKLPKSNNWSLDMVGGYGNIKETVIKWCESQSNVNYVGTWDNEQVCYKMREYDCCIVPSKYDGWNLTPNQAINAEIGTIITNQAGSDELIEYSHAGTVVTADDVDALFVEIFLAIGNEDLLTNWKENARKYKNRISSSTVGQYFIDIMDYTFGGIPSEKPVCPWTGE